MVSKTINGSSILSAPARIGQTISNFFNAILDYMIPADLAPLSEKVKKYLEDIFDLEIINQ